MSTTAVKGRYGIPALAIVLALLAAVSCGRQNGDRSAGGEGRAETAGPSSVAPAADKFASWVEYGSDVHGFAVLTPKAFEVTRDMTQTAAGEIELTTYLAELGQAAYGVVCNDFPEGLVTGKDPNALIKGGSQGFINEFGGTVTGERLLSLDGNPGLEVALNGTTQGVDIFAKGRFYLVGKRMYQVTVIAEKGGQDLEAIDKFLSSFKLK